MILHSRQSRYTEIMLSFVWIIVVSAHAQDPTGSIYGTVTDKSGAVVPNAEVTATEKTTNSSRSTTTNDQGQYDIRRLQPGKYKLTVSDHVYKQTTVSS